MIAVCGIGRPSGLLNSATTAYQSARPPMVAASAKAAMKPNTGCIGNIAFAPRKMANVAASTPVASNFTRRSSAARAASPGVSMTNVPGRLMTAFEEDSRLCQRTSSLRAQRSNPSHRGRRDGLPRRFAPLRKRFAFVAGNDEEDATLIYDDTPQKEGPPKRAFENAVVRRSRSGGLGVDLGKIVLHVLGTVGDELAEIFGGGLRPRDEHFAARTDHVRLDLGGFAQRLRRSG